MIKERKKNWTKKIFELEALTGILLLIASILAIFIANSQFKIYYESFFAIKLPINFQIIGITKSMSLLDWINDFLMSIFFLLVTLELKEEVHEGELSNFKRVILPLICAIGGVIIPIIIYYFFNYQHPNNLKGFAIPTATDIAFAYGIICLFGKKINKSLKVFIISLAIFDDLLAIFFIGFFYSHDLNLFYGFLALGIMAILGILNFKKIYRLEFYIILGLVLWLLILKSSIHPSIAGVVLAIFITHQKNFIKKIISSIAPLVNFMILPIFAFANSAVYFNNFTFEMINDPLFLGIFFGLFLGKQIGVMLFAYLAIFFNITHLPRCSKNGEVSWWQFYSVSIITGIGFTMSFFIGNLAFDDQLKSQQIKLAVLLASCCCGLLGIIVFYLNQLFANKRIINQH
jgi:NhaA family Na+:H+ antiporter